MRYYANPSTEPVRDAMKAGLIDCITTPKQGNDLALVPGVPICADNGAFGKGYPGDGAWFSWLMRLPLSQVTFAVAPDVPFDSLATLDRSLPWFGPIRELGIKAALVAQNHFEDIALVPWDEFDVLFLGGTAECVRCSYVRPVGDFETEHCPTCERRLIEWKIGAAAHRLTVQAKGRGKQVHMGRVNSFKRLHKAQRFGCDSADGTYVKHGPDTNLPKLLDWLDRVHSRPTLDAA